MKSRYLALILALICAAAGLMLLLRPRGGLRAEVRLGGELVASVDLAALTGPVEIPAGEHVTVLAEPGRVRVLESDCPDKLCMGMGWTSSPAKPIVCLPNGVTVTVVGGGGEEDAVLR